MARIRRFSRYIRYVYINKARFPSSQIDRESSVWIRKREGYTVGFCCSYVSSNVHRNVRDIIKSARSRLLALQLIDIERESTPNYLSSSSSLYSLNPSRFIREKMAERFSLLLVRLLLRSLGGGGRELIFNAKDQRVKKIEETFLTLVNHDDSIFSIPMSPPPTPPAR